jgi:hypothetical protein
VDAIGEGAGEQGVEEFVGERSGREVTTLKIDGLDV